MSDIGTYSFLPWIRNGLASEIAAADFDNTVRVRAKVNVQLELRGEKLTGGTEPRQLSRPVALFGPGDIVGIDQRAIVRVEPRPQVTNFEPNYLPLIEFYDEDFPWRYTPARPDPIRGRLRPWLTLLALEEGEFSDEPNLKDRPLPSIRLQDLGVLPKADELWAWAHVHVNRSLAGSDAEFMSRDMNAVIPRLEAVLRQNPDLAYSRIVCPRKLKENTRYHALLIPTFETGRRAGLGLELGDVAATLSAWDAGPRPEPQSFPVYFRWGFTTATTGDFESLVRLLQPRPVDRRVGTREMDVLFPGSGVQGLPETTLGGILKLGGALQPPPTEPPTDDPFESWDTGFPIALQQDLAEILNRPDDLEGASGADPIVAPPIYGTWHARTKRILNDRGGAPVAATDNWVHRLNLDPRFRAAAGLGTRVIQDRQETFMDAAWEQVGRILDAQRRVRLGQFGVLVSQTWWTRHLQPIVRHRPQQGLFLMAPLNRMITSNGLTLHHTFASARVQPTILSPTFRRMMRPRGRLIQALPFDGTQPAEALLERVNDGEVNAAPPKTTPAGIATAQEGAAALMPKGVPLPILTLLRRYPALPQLAAIAGVLFALILLVVVGLAVALVAAILALVVYLLLRKWRDQLWIADVVAESPPSVKTIDSLPGATDFVISGLGSGFVPKAGPYSVEAARFKDALRETFEFMGAAGAAGRRPELVSVNLESLAGTALSSIEPAKTIPKRVMSTIAIPARITAEIGDGFVEPMAYPVIDLPMYEPLKDRSAELFLPNLNLIEPNTVTLMETNQRFIESYMVGLNHEFARELLWREFPTDSRGSTFRQFWDVRSFFDADGLDDESLREKLRDIKPLHRWSTSAKLGDFDNREEGGANEEELVLVIRGELLKRYPTAVIYAHRACWQRRDDGTSTDRARDPCLRAGAIDNSKERRLAPLTAAEELKPPRAKIRTPLYEAKVDPDIYFLGFDLTAKDARGQSGESPTDDPGWFFVIKERPGDPRFGLDLDRKTDLSVWNDLSWPDVQPGAPGTYIDLAGAPAAFPLVTPGVADQEKDVQFQDDRKVAWGRDMSSAEMAYILFQAPVLVGVHAIEMLQKGAAV